MNKKNIIRITIEPPSLWILLTGQMKFMSENGFQIQGVTSSRDEFRLIEENERVEVMPIEMMRTISPLQDLAARAREVVVQNFRRSYIWQELLREYQSL